MADFNDFVDALSADTIGGSENIPVVDSNVSKRITPDLLKTYIVAYLTGLGVQAPTAGDAFIIERSGTEHTMDLDALAAYVFDKHFDAAAITPLVSGDLLLLERSGTKKRFDIDTLVSFVNSENGTLAAQITALATATMADSDEYILNQGGTGKKVSFTNLSARSHSQLNAYIATLSATTTPVDANELYLLQGSTPTRCSLTTFANTYLSAELDVEDLGWDMAEKDPVAAGDMLLMRRSGATWKIDVDSLVTYAATGLQAAVLTFSSLAAASPNAADMFAVDDAGTAKKLTLANLETRLWIDYNAYVVALTHNSTVTATDKIYCIQGGTAKYVTPVELSAYYNVTTGNVNGPVATIEHNVPQWDSTTKLLKDGYSVVTTVRFTGSESDTALATEKAVSEAVENISNFDIDGATDIGAGLVDADLIIVDDGAGGANRKCAMSRVATYVGATVVSNLDIDGATDIGAALSSGDLLIVDDGAGGTNRKCAVSRIQTYLETSGHYDNIYIPASQMHVCTTAGAAALAKNEYGTNDIDLEYFAFDTGATEERVQFSLAMPENWDRSTVKFKFYWSSATSSSIADTVEWGIKGGSLSNDAAIDAALGTAVVISDAILAANGTDLQISGATPACTVGGTPTLGDLITFEVYRNTDGTDNMTEDAWLFGVHLQYQRNKTVVAW